MQGKIANLHQDLVDILTDLEIYMGFELTITSGQRTHEHNDDPKVGGVKNSEHTYDPAEGADVLCKQGVTRYKMLQHLFKVGVRRIGVGKEFIHVGISELLPQNVVWAYYKD